MRKSILFLSVASSAISLPLCALAQSDDHDHKDDIIIVTGSPIAHGEHDSIIAASVLTEEELASRGEASLGELLRHEPGVSSSFFGPAASRPIIRGLGGDRVGVLDAGIGSIDASSVSDDHAVAVEPATVERVKIVRGAATLYYGSSAAGGVVNVFDGRIPDAIPEDGVDGALRTSLGSVDDSVEAAGGFDLLVGKIGSAEVVLHGDGFFRNTDDYEVPGFAKSTNLRAIEQEEAGPGSGADEGAFGIVENSDLETKGGSIGGSIIFEDGYFGISGKVTRSNYAVPGGTPEPGAGEVETVRIDLEQDRFDLMGELNTPFLIFETVKIRAGYADYIHQELEGAEIGTTFKNEGYEGRIELLEKEFGNFRGASGVQFKHRDFEAIGDEAFTPPNITTQFGVFTVREYETGNWHVQLAGRYEYTDIKANSVNLSRSFDGISLSAGLGVEPKENLFFGINLLRTERPPAPEELFSDGPHLATNAFEIGDPDLGMEIARGVDVSLHGEFGRFSATVNGFYTDYRNFIALIPNGAEQDELPVFEFIARYAVFKGFEAEVDADLFSLGAFDVMARAQVDYVRANFKNGGGDVPRIPPLRSILGMEATSSHLDLRGEVEIASRQNKIAAIELPTDGYTLVNLAATWRPGGEDSGLSVQLRADNVTNEEARLHTSFLKDVAPLPGRNIKLTLRATF
ncbi:MAG: TonB-dependent receptor [Marinicaulis sp.]|nr:TonB-dependent receptor [Marinicaulis sp.]